MTNDIDDPAVASALLDGGLVVLRTDTLYGLIARADSEGAVARVYYLKQRDQAKSPVVMIADSSQMFDEPPVGFASLVADGWPDRTSLVLPSRQAPSWIRRDNSSVAYRRPSVDSLQRLLLKVGPLIAPSANPEGLPPATTIDQAVDYFGESVEVYVDGGPVLDNTPSRILRMTDDGEIERLR